MLTGWRYVEENRTSVVGGDEIRQSAELTGHAAEDEAGGVVQALYVSTTDRPDWNEFVWEDPLWSSRSSEAPAWKTRSEPGAFEPPFRFAYLTQLDFATQLAGVLDDRVFEGLVALDGVDVQRYCIVDPELDAVRDGGLLRFLVHPDGYVTEWVYAQSTATTVRCQEITLWIGRELSATGMHDDEPVEWLTEPEHLASCRDGYEAGRAELRAADTVETSTTTGAPIEPGPWHEGVDEVCSGWMENPPSQDDLVDVADRFDTWTASAPSDVERDALAAAADGLRSDDRAATSMDPIGRRLDAAGLPGCGALFIGG